MPVIENRPSGKNHEPTLAQLSAESKVVAGAQKIALEAVQGIGFFSAVVESNPEPLDRDQSIASWCCIFCTKSQIWIDVVVEAELLSTEAAFRGLTGTETSTKEDAYDLLGEIANFVRGGFKKGMSAEGGETLTPGTPKEVPGGNIYSATHYRCPSLRTHFKADDFRVVTTFLFNKQVPVPKTLGKLRPLDISLESIPIMKGSTLEVLAKGVALNATWIEKLRARYMKEEKERKIIVVTPPQVTELFHPKFHYPPQKV